MRKIRRNDRVYNATINAVESVEWTGRWQRFNRPGTRFFCTDDSIVADPSSDFKLLKRPKKERSPRPKQCRRK